MLDPKRVGLAGGILGSLWVFLLTLLSFSTGYAAMYLTMVSDLYPGYSISLNGAFIGLIYGFLEGYIFLYLFAWLYNHLKKR